MNTRTDTVICYTTDDDSDDVLKAVQIYCLFS